MDKQNPVVHFELPYEDRERMVDFYKRTFGWQANMLGPDMGNYVVVMTSETDEKTNFPKKPGMINGGLFEKNQTLQHPSVVLGVSDIREAIEKIKQGGGKIVGGQKPGEPDDIPGVGLYIVFEDTEGNRLSVLQPKGM